jgi:hypothetical protein
VDNYTQEALAVDADQNLKEKEKKNDYPVLIPTGERCQLNSPVRRGGNRYFGGAVQQDRAGWQEFSVFGGFNPEQIGCSQYSADNEQLSWPLFNKPLIRGFRPANAG